MLLRRLGGQAVEGLQILVPVLVFRPQYGDPGVSVFYQDICEAAGGLDPRGVVVQAEHDLLEPGVLLQHPEHGVLRGAAEGHIAVLLPCLRVQRQKGQHVDGRLEHIEPAAVPEPVEAAPGIAALHIAPEALALGCRGPACGRGGQRRISSLPTNTAL